MTAFRIFLIAIIAIVGGYTAITIANHGINFWPGAIADIAQMAWRGQFNVDFISLLLLSGLWVAWRHHFSSLGLLLGFLAANLGAPYLAAYLLIASYQTNGDIKAILLGQRRANAA